MGPFLHIEDVTQAKGLLSPMSLQDDQDQFVQLRAKTFSFPRRDRTWTSCFSSLKTVITTLPTHFPGRTTKASTPKQILKWRSDTLARSVDEQTDAPARELRHAFASLIIVNSPPMILVVTPSGRPIYSCVS